MFVEGSVPNKGMPNKILLVRDLVLFIMWKCCVQIDFSSLVTGYVIL